MEGEEFTHPTTYSYDPAFAAGYEGFMFHGLTKRELFFIKILNGLLAGRSAPHLDSEFYVSRAIEMTDTSIKALNETI